VIVDATFLKRAQRARFRRLAADLAVPFRILHCRASLEELRRRLVARAQRGIDASEADLDVLALQVGSQEPFAEEELPYVTEYDAGGRSSFTTLAAGLNLDVDPAKHRPEGEGP
jgi:predicted kinase